MAFKARATSGLLEKRYFWLMLDTGQGLRFWLYVSADTSSDISGSGYIDDAEFKLVVRPNDFVLAIQTGGIDDTREISDDIAVGGVVAVSLHQVIISNGSVVTISDNLLGTLTEEAVASPPSLLSPAAVAVADGTSGTLTVTTTEDTGEIYWVATTTTEKPSEAQMRAGSDSNGNPVTTSGTQVVTSIGSQTIALTSLTPGTTYYVHVMHENDTMVASSIVSTAAFTTSDVPDAFDAADFAVADATTGEQVDLTISDLPDNGGDTISDIEYTTDDGTSWRTVGGATAATYNLTLESDGTIFTNDVAYTFKVRAININGASAASVGEAATPTGAGTTNTFNQAAYRLYDDDAALQSATPLAGVNESASIEIDTNFRLRFLIKQEGTDTGNTPAFNWEYRRKPDGGSFGSWTALGTDSVPDDPIQSTLSTHYANNADTAQLLGSGTFTDGQALENDRTGGTLDASVGQDEYEVENCLVFNSSSTGTVPAAGDTYEVRVFEAPSSNFDTYTNTATITIPSTGPVGGGGTPGASVAPYERRGFGASTTGGGQASNAKVVFVTSTSANASTSGSLPWALNQHGSLPLYIVPIVEGALTITSPLTITRDNVTIDGRLAPGMGFWILQNRLQPHGDNFEMIGISHYGNDVGAFNDSDCIRIGPHSGSSGTASTSNHYYRNCTFMHGRDETFAMTPRKNGNSTGNTVTGVTIDRCITANPVEPAHAFLNFVGDGCTEITFVDTLMYNGKGRYPFVRGNANKVEILNCLLGGNFNELGLVLDGPFVIYNHFAVQWHPGSTKVRPPFAQNGADQVYYNDFVEINKATNGWPGELWRGAAPAASPKFTQSITDANLVSSSIVKDRLTNTGDNGILIGKPRYGGATRPDNENAVITEVIAGTASSLKIVSGHLPTATGDGYPSSNANNIPNNYLEWHPSDTNPESIISDGSDWDGYLVIQRVCEFVASSFYGTSP